MVLQIGIDHIIGWCNAAGKRTNLCQIVAETAKSLDFWHDMFKDGNEKSPAIAGLELFEATPLGLEPRIKEPKSLVLPITPRSNHFRSNWANLPIR